MIFTKKPIETDIIHEFYIFQKKESSIELKLTYTNFKTGAMIAHYINIICLHHHVQNQGEVMKKSLTAIDTIALTLTSFATTNSAKELHQLKDEVKFVLEGKLIKHIQGSFYQFKDKTGVVTVNIDSNQPVVCSNKEIVRLHGEVDIEDNNQVEYDINYVEKKNELPTKVSAAQKMADEQKVKMEGVLAKHVAGELYILKDATGVITLEIDNMDYPTSTLKIGKKYTFFGEIDKEDHLLKIDVESLELAK
jgi:uncharacterized protein (TIGR00156 family)